MDSMVDRVAKALSNDTDADWQAMPTLHKAVFYSMARAALQALMEPTPRMMQAGAELSLEKDVEVIARLNANAIFREMIRSAMEGE